MTQFPFRRSGKGTLTSAAFVLLGITAAALATGACIVGILCLPLILLLVYKQRQVASHRRKYLWLGWWWSFLAVRSGNAWDMRAAQASPTLQPCKEPTLWLRGKGTYICLSFRA